MPRPSVAPAALGQASVAGRAEASPASPAPAVFAHAALGIPYQHDREEGTDGLMGGIPFGLPADTPLVRRERVNRFTIDDVSGGWSRPDSPPPWVRRVGGLPTFATDPHER
ncbi:MAG TPA: hypothetical protein VFI34_01635 [Candidatus Limnocylindrales bacterium]|nr:hypothetical protein [Candidatus Limnocylindrales bacterium]